MDFSNWVILILLGFSTVLLAVICTLAVIHILLIVDKKAGIELFEKGKRFFRAVMDYLVRPFAFLVALFVFMAILGFILV